MDAELAKYDAAVSAIYAAAASPDLWPTALDAIARYFDSIGTVLIMHGVGQKVSTIVSPTLVRAAQEYEAGAWRLDYLFPRAVARAALEPHASYSDRHLTTPQEMAAHPFYTTFRKSHGLGPFLAAQVLPHPDIVAVMTVQGSIERETFTDTEVEEYSALMKHAERALTLSVRLIEAEARSHSFGRALSLLSCGVFAVDDSGSVTLANSAAERMLKSFISKLGQQMIFSGPLAKAIKSASQSKLQGDPPPKPMIVEEHGKRIIIYILAANNLSVPIYHEVFIRSRWLVLAIEHDPSAQVDPAVVRDLLDLSQGEARLASLVGAGRTPRQAAERLGITEGSARTILKRVYVKTNTSRQSELAALLSRLGKGK